MRPTMGILGFGYTAAFLAAKLSELDFNIIGTSRNPQTREFYSKVGYRLFNFDTESIKSLFCQATHILITAPPSESLGDPVLFQFLPLLKKYCHQWKWLGYTSSTGVYGDHQGAWVDESSSPQNLGARAKLRLETEISWQNLAKKYNLPLHIFRLAGIYGPQRDVLCDIVNGKNYSIYKEGQFFSRIHVADIANIILLSMQKVNPGSIYNVADDLPAASHEVDQYATTLLNKNPLPLIPFEEAALSKMTAEFYSNNRRVSNAKVKREFGLQLDYPSYRGGLFHIFQRGEYLC